MGVDFMNTLRKQCLLETARAAGACLKAHFNKGIQIRKKGTLDLVTAADEAAEALIIAAIQKDFPDDAIVAEESGSKSGSSGYQWIIDPLDGTTNFAHNFPQFAVSIAIAKDNLVVLGAVFDPIKDEFFFAEKEKGAYLNDHPIHVNDRQELVDALGVTGFSYDRRQRMDELLNRARNILENCQGLRRLGSAALDLCYTACGRFDIFIEDGLNAWDIAAGQLIVTEAGGVVSQLDGSSLDIFSGEILATNKDLQSQALAKLT